MSAGGAARAGGRGPGCSRPSEGAGSRSLRRRKNLVFFTGGGGRAGVSSCSDGGTGMHISRSWIPSGTRRSARLGPPATGDRLRASDPGIQKALNARRSGGRQVRGGCVWARARMRAPVSGRARDKASGGFAVQEWPAGEDRLPAWRMNELCAGGERKGRDLPPASRSPGGGSRFGALSLGPVTFCDLSAPALGEEGGAESELRATVGSGQVGCSSWLAFSGERCPFFMPRQAAVFGCFSAPDSASWVFSRLGHRSRIDEPPALPQQSSPLAFVSPRHSHLLFRV